MAEIDPRFAPIRGSLHDPLHVRVFRVGSLTIDPGWNAAQVQDPFWRLYVNDREGASVDLDRGSHVLTAERVHLIPAWVRFTCRCRRNVSHFYIHFDIVGLTSSMTRELFDRPITLPVDATSRQMCLELAAALKERDEVSVEKVMQTKALVNWAIALLMGQLPADSVGRMRGEMHTQRLLAPALRHIESNLGRPILNCELARLCFMSEDHFIRRFRDGTGQTPRQYIIEHRIAAAARRMLLTDQSIDEIAEFFGFADRFHLSHMFSRIMGQPPAAYRKAILP